MPTRPDT